MPSSESEESHQLVDGDVNPSMTRSTFSRSNLAFGSGDDLRRVASARSVGIAATTRCASINATASYRRISSPEIAHSNSRFSTMGLSFGLIRSYSVDRASVTAWESFASVAFCAESITHEAPTFADLICHRFTPRNSGGTA